MKSGMGYLAGKDVIEVVQGLRPSDSRYQPSEG